MKIAIIRRECGFGTGGAEAYCANVSSEFSKRGHHVTVIADRSSVEGLDFIRAQVYGRGSIAKNISFFRSVESILQNNSFDITYGLSRVAPVDILRISDPLHAAWLDLGYERLRWLRKIMPRHRMLLMLEKRAVLSAKKIVVNSSLVKGQLMKYYKIPSGNIEVVYNGVNHSRFCPVSGEKYITLRKELGLDRDDRVLLFAGTDLRRKGFPALSEAFVSLICALNGLGCKEKLYLLIAGCNDKNRFKRFFDNRGVSDRFKWLGYREDMEDLYAISDLFLLPTRYDPFANTTLEAMRCGTPVLTTAYNGASEVSGLVAPWLVVPRVDSSSIANALSLFLELTEEERKGLGKKAFIIASDYEWKGHVDKLEDCFKKK